MEAKTCEEYVLGELEEAKARIVLLEKENYALKSKLVDYVQENEDGEEEWAIKVWIKEGMTEEEVLEEVKEVYEAVMGAKEAGY